MSGHGIHLFARTRVPDGSARDCLVFMDAGYRMGRHQDGFGAMPPAPTQTHPMIAGMAQKRSLLSWDPEWTNVYGKKMPVSPDPDPTDRPRVHRMKGGITVYTVDQPSPTQSPTKKGLSRTASAPSPLSAKSTGSSSNKSAEAWRSRETVPSFESWSTRDKISAAATGKYTRGVKAQPSRSASGIDAATR